MGKMTVCCSFDYEVDHNYYFLLKAWNENPQIPFSIVDGTPSEIQTESVEVVKQVLSRKIHEVHHMIAIIGQDACKMHPDALEIGSWNWQSFEIAKNHEYGNELLCVKLKPWYSVPSIVDDIPHETVEGFSREKIKDAMTKMVQRHWH